MKKILKIIFKIIGITLVAIIILLAVIPLLFKNKILQVVKNEANKSLNAKVEFSDVKLSFFRKFPALNLQLDDLHIVGIDEFENDTLVKFNYFSTNIKPWSVIFKKQIKINSIILDQPEINIIVLENGKANYDIVKTDSTDTEELEEPEVDEEEEEDNEKTKKPYIINLKKLKINDAKVIYDDQQINIYAKLENLNFKLKGNLSEDYTSIKFKLAIDSISLKYGNVQYIDRAKFVFTSKIDADMVNQKYTFEDNLLKINKLHFGFDGYVSMPDSNITMDVSFATKKATFKNALTMVPAIYQKDFEEIATDGIFAIDGHVKGTYNSKQIPAVSANLSIKDAWFRYPDLPEAVTDINIEAHYENPGNMDINIVDISNFSMNVAQNPIRAKLYAKTSATDVYTSGNINAKIDLTSVEKFYPLGDMTLSGKFETDLNFKGNLSDIENENYENFDTDGKILITNMETKQAGLPPISVTELELLFSPEIVNLKSFDAQIGKSDIHLNGKIFNIFQYIFSNEPLTADFNFNSNLFDANDFLSYNETEPELETNDNEEPIETLQETNSKQITAFSIPNNLNLTLTTNIEKVFFEKLEVNKIEGLIELSNGRLSLTNLSMNLLKGSMQLSAIYDSKNIKNPFAEFNFEMKNIDIIETYNTFISIQELAPMAKNCHGNISASININSTLDYYLKPVYNTLNGDGYISSNNFAVKDNVIFTSLANLTKIEAYKNPSIKELFLNFEIVNGNIEVKPTSFTLVNTEASIQGTTNLDKTINYQLGVTVPLNTAKNLISNFPFLNQHKNVEIFAIIGGTLTDPKIEDFGSQLIDDVKEEIIEGLTEAAKKYLTEARKKADKIIEDAKKERDKLIKEAEKQVDDIKKQAKSESDRLINEADAAGQKLIDEAKNPVAKRLAREAAERLKAEAKIEANKKIEQGTAKTKGKIRKATTKGNKLVKEAETLADKTIKDAEKKAKNM